MLKLSNFVGIQRWRGTWIWYLYLCIMMDPLSPINENSPQLCSPDDTTVAHLAHFFKHVGCASENLYFSFYWKMISMTISIVEAHSLYMNLSGALCCKRPNDSQRVQSTSEKRINGCLQRIVKKIYLPFLKKYTKVQISSAIFQYQW